MLKLKKRKPPKRVVRKLDVEISIGSLVLADEKLVRAIVPKGWKLKDLIKLRYARRRLLKYEVLIT